jgi:hypothetical protein
MPTIEEICVELHCLQEAGKYGPVEEFAPRLQNEDEDLTLAPFMPKLYDRESRICSVFVPTMPQAQFYLKYFVQPPTDNMIFYVFKMYINQKHIINFSCGPEQSFCGRASFGISDTSKVNQEGSGLQKQIFFFNREPRVVGDLSQDKDEDRMIEIRAYRANKKMRTPTSSTTTRPFAKAGNADIEVRADGPISTNQPLRHYIFGLLDPDDKPRATFRFYYRSWDELHQLKLRLGTVVGEDTALFKPFPDEAEILLKDPKRKTVHVNADPRQHPYNKIFPRAVQPPTLLQDQYQSLPPLPPPHHHQPHAHHHHNHKQNHHDHHQLAQPLGQARYGTIVNHVVRRPTGHSGASYENKQLPKLPHQQQVPNPVLQYVPGTGWLPQQTASSLSSGLSLSLPIVASRPHDSIAERPLPPLPENNDHPPRQS